MKPQRNDWILVAGFFLSRATYAALGLRFDSETLSTYFQWIDPVLLRQDLIASVVHLHGQPPLFNLFLGVVLKLAGEWAFHPIFLCMGLCLTLLLYRVLLNVGCRTWLALTLTSIYTVHPTTVLYENWLFYAYPLTLVLLASVAALLTMRRDPSGKWAWVFFATLAVIALTRSMFHLVWVLGGVTIVAIGFRHRLRVILWPAAICVGLIGAWYAKNAVLFGTFGPSTWLGMSLAKATTFQVPADEREAMVSRGDLTPYALIPPFSDLGAYDLNPPITGSRLLNSATKSGGANNFHHIAYVEIGDAYRKDALACLKARPLAYMRQLPRSIMIFFLPAGDYRNLNRNRDELGLIYSAFNLLTCGQFRLQPSAYKRDRFTSTLLSRMGWGLALGIPLLVGLSAISVCRGEIKPPLRVATVYVLFTVAYVFAVSIAFEGTVLFEDRLWLGEQNRFRFPLTPLFLILLGIQIQTRVLDRKPKGPRAG